MLGNHHIFAKLEQIIAAQQSPKDLPFQNSDLAILNYHAVGNTNFGQALTQRLISFGYSLVKLL